MYRVCIPLFSRCVFLTRIPWQLFSDEQSRRSPGRVWSGIWNPISSHWHLDPYNCRLYYIYAIYTAILLSLLLKEVMVQSWKNQSKTIAENFAAPLSLQNLFASSWKNVSTTFYNISQTQTATGGCANVCRKQMGKLLVPPWLDQDRLKRDWFLLSVECKLPGEWQVTLRPWRFTG